MSEAAIRTRQGDTYLTVKSPKDWVVYEHSGGVVWEIMPPNREMAETEAELVGIGHEAMTRARAEDSPQRLCPRSPVRPQTRIP